MFDGLDDEQEEDEIEANEQEEDEDSEQEDDEQEENEDDNSEHEIEEEMDSKGKGDTCLESDEDDIPCVICKKHDRMEKVINWIQCTECECWVYEMCLPRDTTG